MLYYSKVQYIINIICHRYLTLDYDVRFFVNLCVLPKDLSIFIMKNVSFYSITNWGGCNGCVSGKNSRYFQVFGPYKVFFCTSQPKFRPKIALLRPLLRRHCKGAVGNIISDIVRYQPYQVHACLPKQSTYLVRNMQDKVHFCLFYSFLERFDDVTRRHCMVGFAIIIFIQRRI